MKMRQVFLLRIRKSLTATTAAISAVEADSTIDASIAPVIDATLPEGGTGEVLATSSPGLGTV